MTVRERMQKVLNFEKPDRLPIFELSGWWDKTYTNWFEQGIDKDAFWRDSYSYMGMDKHLGLFIPSENENYDYKDGQGNIEQESDYEPFKERCLFPAGYVKKNEETFKFVAYGHELGNYSVWLNFQGFFWFPRTVFGIEGHLYAFYDYPDLMKRMNAEYLDYLMAELNDYFAIDIPDFVVISEDMSYNHGPMCSKEQFDEFLAPYYRPLVKRLKELGIKVLVDTDGNATDMIDWFLEVGVEGFTPNERRAGTDIVKIREKYPNLLLMGGFDKNIMNQGEEAIRAEFERIYPVMCQGGYIPGCDHQTPPQVSIHNYFEYQRIQREYCKKAAENFKGKENRK